MAEGLGFEPRLTGPEPVVLPLDDPSVVCKLYDYNISLNASSKFWIWATVKNSNGLAGYKPSAFEVRGKINLLLPTAAGSHLSSFLFYLPSFAIAQRLPAPQCAMLFATLPPTSNLQQPQAPPQYTLRPSQGGGSRVRVPKWQLSQKYPDWQFFQSVPRAPVGRFYPV